MPSTTVDCGSPADFNAALCSFIDRSPTPFHACSAIAAQLEAAGFRRLDEAQSWSLETGDKCYVTRNDSSIVAFVVGKQPLEEVGLRGLGAHTDSPALKIKPRPDIIDNNSWRLGVEVYGGALLNPWFDRDLSLAGRVHYRDRAGIVRSSLIDFACPVGTIPSLAIHLDREANTKRCVNAQLHLPLLLATYAEGQAANFAQLLTEQLQRQFAEQGLGNDVDEILDHEMYCYDTQKAQCIGIRGDFIAAARLDNLLSCFVNTQVMCALESDDWSVMVCNDHEEVGSNSAAGAAGPFLKSVLERLAGSHAEKLTRSLQHSMFISVDNAHALHPSYADKMDPNHSPLINGGPVIKVNAEQRYASNSETQAIFRAACIDEKVPVQQFVIRSDLRCGSTIGPITATELGVKTLDVGVPTYAMHSIRELAGSEDPMYLYKALSRFMHQR